MSVAVQPLPKEKILYYPGPSYFVGRVTYEDYIAFEPESGPRFELINGSVYKIPDGALNHNRICGNAARVIANQMDLMGVVAEAFGSNQKIFVNAKNAFYPDMSVILDTIETDDQDALLNPALLVEVLSPSTAGFERGEKFEKYQTLPSLQHYILITQGRVSVTHYEKIAGNLWAIVGSHNDLEQSVTLTLSEVTMNIPLTAIYRRVEIPLRSDDAETDESGEGME